MRVIVAFLIFFVESASACVNTYESDILVMMYKGEPEAIAQTVRDLEATNARAPTIQSKNDLAAAYIITGKYDEAITILTNVEQEHPGNPRIASNLGTALELSGKNAEALHWIEEGIARDPDDHQGTEWLHVAVLEAKVALEKDPGWLETHSVLGVDFGSEVHPRMPSVLRLDRPGWPDSLEAMEKAMDYQLRERLKFVTAPDPIVANLYRARADIAYLQRSQAAGDYYLAATFFGANDDLTKRRAEQFRIERSQSMTVGTFSLSLWKVYALVAALLSSIAAVGFHFMRKSSRQRARAGQF